MGAGAKAPSIPAGYSPEEIERQRKESEDRAKFEQEMADYLKSASTTEVATRTAIEQRQNSLEFGGDQNLPPVSSLYVPERFRSAVAASLTDEERRAYGWLEAQNLGYYGNQEANTAFAMQQATKEFEFIKSGQASYYMIQDLEAERARLEASGASLNVLQNYDMRISNIKAEQAMFNTMAPMTSQEIGMGDWRKNTGFSNLVSYTGTFFKEAGSKSANKAGVDWNEVETLLEERRAKRKQQNPLFAPAPPPPPPGAPSTPPIGTGSGYGGPGSGYGGPSTSGPTTRPRYGFYTPRSAF